MGTALTMKLFTLCTPGYRPHTGKVCYLLGNRNVFCFLSISVLWLGKDLAQFMDIPIFILAGTGHSVAKMYYGCTSGELYRAPEKSSLRILLVSLGNLVGGLFFPL